MKKYGVSYRVEMDDPRTGNGFGRSFESFVAAIREIRRASRRLGMDLISFRRPDGSDVRGPANRVPEPARFWRD